jgi:hypothetical protein
MTRIFTSTALALVLGLAAGIGASITAAPAQAQSDCVRAAALDLNGDNWIDGDERDAARNAGFRNFDSNGDLFVSADEMNRCLNGGTSAFRWLSGSNPNFASAGVYSGPSDMQAPAPSYAPSATTSYDPAYDGGVSYDRGAAFDTPSPVAREAALRYLQDKVNADPRYQPQSRPVESPQLLQIEPAAGPVPDPLDDFSFMDTNADGMVSTSEYLDYRNRTASY